MSRLIGEICGGIEGLGLLLRSTFTDFYSPPAHCGADETLYYEGFTHVSESGSFAGNKSVV